MADITAAMVRELRDKSGAAMMDCKKALEATQGDIEGAFDELRKRGLKAAAKKEGRATGQGRLAAHLSEDGRKGAMVALAYSRFPVDWKAPDGAPVRAAFLILSASRNEHLVTLSALAKLCGDAEFYAALGRRAALEDIVALIGRKAEA